jgi:hypothetical protein
VSAAPLIVGNNLAAMVAALELAGRGCPVRLLNPAKGWGGHFAGFQRGERRFDAGMILMEFGAFNAEASPDIQDYDPSRRNDCGRFAPRVGEYLQSLLPCREIPTPSLLHEGRILPDLFIANCFDVLQALPTAQAARIRGELEQICSTPRGRLHASRKLADPLFLDADLESASIANHGASLHAALFEPLCRKIAGCATREVIALYHRVPWLPLFHPETLLSQFGEAPQQLPATRFHYPVAGHAGALAESLADRIAAHPGIEVIQVQPVSAQIRGRSVHLQLADGRELATERLAWSGDPGRLLGLLHPEAAQPAYQRASVGLGFMAIPADKLLRPFSTLYVPDARYASYRITDQEVCAGLDAAEHRLVVEFHPPSESPGPAPASDEAMLAHELVAMGLIESPGSITWSTTMTLNQALMHPGWHNRRQFLGQLAWLQEEIPGAALIGASAGFFASSLNDQVVQGLKLAGAWG